MTSSDPTTINLQHLVESAWGHGKRAGKARVYKSRWRDDRNPSFAVYADGFKDFATGEHGDVIEFVRRERGLDDRRAALAWLSEHGYAIPADPLHKQQTAEQTETDAPPAAAWQRAALAAVEYSQRLLWSGHIDADRALNYLRGRGLTDDTIRAAGLGFNPSSRRVEIAPGELVTLSAGIIIPISVNGVLFAVKVNTFGAAGLALAFERQPLNFAKYIHLTGSQTGAPYVPAGALADDLPVLIVEGEYDAMIAAQQLHGLANVITVGSATNRLARRWRTLLGGRAVFIAGDNDDAGRAGAERLAQQLPGAAVIRLPDGCKDANEYHLSGGDLRLWFTTPQTVAAIPDLEAGRAASRSSWVNALQHIPGGGVNVAMVCHLVMEGVNRGIVDPQGFTLTDIKRGAAALDWQITNDSTIRRGLALGVEMGLFANLTMNRSQPLIVRSANNLGGRSESIYALPSVDDMHMAIMRASYPDIDQAAYPTPDDDPNRAALAELTPLALEQVGVSADDAKAVSAEFCRARAGVRNKRDGAAWYRAKEKRESLAAMLRDTTPLKLDPAFPVKDAKTFKTAVFRALAVGHDGEQIAQRSLAQMAGVRSRTTLKRVMAMARIGVQEQSIDELTESRTIQPGEDAHAAIRQHVSEIGGAAFALRIIPPETDQREFSQAVAPGQAAEIAGEHLSAGRTVIVQYRRAYRLNVLSPDSPSPVMPAARSHRHTDPVVTERRAPVEIGHYRPAWVAGQVAYLMNRLGWRAGLTERRYSDDGEIVSEVFRNPATGDECSADSRYLPELLRVFTGKDIAVNPPEIGGDSLLTFARMLGATIEAIA